MEILVTIGWGIIGTGRHADRVTGPALSQAANTELVAVCDLSMEQAQSFAARHGLQLGRITNAILKSSRQGKAIEIQK